MGKLTLSSSLFSNGEEIPKKHGYKNSNSRPSFEISSIPQGTQSLAIIMDDPDAQAVVGKIWVHWTIWNIEPNVSEISESSVPSGAAEGKTDFGEIGYGGPAPPDKMHTYLFKLYALDTKLDLPRGSSKNQIEEAMKGHIIDETVLKGTYTP